MTESLEWVDVRDLLEATGARNLTHSGNEFSFSCVSGNHAHGDASPSAGMNARNSLWRCRSPACGLRGNAADYLVALKGLTRSEAMRVLQERYGGPEVSAEPGALEVEVARIRAAGNGLSELDRIAPTEDLYLDRFAVDWPLGAGLQDLPEPMAYMLGRGFTAEILNSWGVGYDEASDRITIPVYDVDGNLVGIKARAYREDQQPRYLTIGHQVGQDLWRYPFHTYMKSMHVFGLHRVGASPFSGRADLILVEGELNVLAMDQMGWSNAVAVAGAEFSEYQARLLTWYAESVVIYFDDDDAGRAGAQRVAEELHPYMPVWIVEGAPGDAADALHLEKDFSPEDLRELVASAVPFLLSSVVRSRLS